MYRNSHTKTFRIQGKETFLYTLKGANMGCCFSQKRHTLRELTSHIGKVATKSTEMLSASGDRSDIRRVCADIERAIRNHTDVLNSHLHALHFDMTNLRSEMREFTNAWRISQGGLSRISCSEDVMSDSESIVSVSGSQTGRNVGMVYRREAQGLSRWDHNTKTLTRATTATTEGEKYDRAGYMVPI